MKTSYNIILAIVLLIGGATVPLAYHQFSDAPAASDPTISVPLSQRVAIRLVDIHIERLRSPSAHWRVRAEGHPGGDHHGIETGVVGVASISAFALRVRKGCGHKKGTKGTQVFHR